MRGCKRLLFNFHLQHNVNGSNAFSKDWEILLRFLSDGHHKACSRAWTC